MQHASQSLPQLKIDVFFLQISNFNASSDSRHDHIELALLCMCSYVKRAVQIRKKAARKLAPFLSGHACFELASYFYDLIHLWATHSTLALFVIRDFICIFYLVWGFSCTTRCRLISWTWLNKQVFFPSNSRGWFKFLTSKYEGRYSTPLPNSCYGHPGYHVHLCWTLGIKISKGL